MKKLIFIVVSMYFIPLTLWGQNNSQFTVQGNIIGYKGTTMYLKEQSFEKQLNRIIDSCTINKDGSFILKAPDTGGEHFFSLLLSANLNTEGLINLINDTQNVNVQLNAANSNGNTITGSPASKALQQYVMQKTAYISEIESLRTNTGDPEKLKSERGQIISKLSTLFTSAVNNASNPMEAIYILSTNPELKDKDALEYSKQLLKKFPQSGELKTYANWIEKKITNYKERKDLLGKKAPDFSLPDPQGKKIALNSIKSKYTLIDFWASWCAPCRIENKNVKAVYDQYKDKGFTVISVSLDDDKKKWIDAVKHDGLPWKQLDEIKAFKSDLATSYDLRKLPSNFLIDQNGTVIAVDIFRDELKSKLAELIK